MDHRIPRRRGRLLFAFSAAAWFAADAVLGYWLGRGYPFSSEKVPEPPWLDYADVAEAAGLRFQHVMGGKEKEYLLEEDPYHLKASFQLTASLRRLERPEGLLEAEAHFKFLERSEPHFEKAANFAARGAMVEAALTRALGYRARGQYREADSELRAIQAASPAGGGAARELAAPGSDRRGSGALLRPRLAASVGGAPRVGRGGPGSRESSGGKAEDAPRGLGRPREPCGPEALGRPPRWPGPGDPAAERALQACRAGRRERPGRAKVAAGEARRLRSWPLPSKVEGRHERQI